MLELIFAVALLSGTDGQRDTVGACAWSQLPTADQEAILTAYGVSMNASMNALYARDARLRAAGGECAQRQDVPLLSMQAAIASHVIQLGAAESVRVSTGLGRERLDQVWTSAPAEARDCALNNASRPFRIAGPRCRDRRAPQAFLTALGLEASSPSTRAASEQVLVYMNAKAQEQIANRLISDMPPATR